MSIQVEFEQKTSLIDKAFIKKQVNDFLKIHQLKSAQVGVHLVDNKTIKRINRDYRNVDKPTDVISFPIDEPIKKEGKLEGKIILGDLFLSLDQIKKKHPNKKTKKAISHCLKHGLVHLLGLDHNSKKEQKKFDKYYNKQ